jgi:hypothetical protein
VAEYYRKSLQEVKIHRMQDGSTVKESDVGTFARAFFEVSP